MAERPPEDPIEAALARLAALQREAASLRATAAAADRALAAGLRLASRMRRRLRSSGERPGGSEVAELESISDGLERDLERALRAPEVTALAEAVAAGSGDRAADLALSVYHGLARLRAEPRAALLWPLPFRRRRPGLGEALPAPEESAALVREIAREGLAPAPSRLSGLTEPVVLTLPSAARPAIALSVRAGDLPAPPLLHGPSGDVWCFAARVGGPFAVAVAREAEDEWWQAGPVSVEDYARALEAALAEDGIPVLRE